MHLALRWLVIVLLCSALAEPAALRQSKDVAVVAIIDASDSVPADQQRRALEFLSASLGRKQPGDRLGLVTIARDGRVQSLTTPRPGPLDMSSPGPTDATALQRGIELARAIIPEDAAGRLLLISDGNSTSGTLAHAVARLRADGVPLDVVVVDYDRSAGVRVEEVILPHWVREGDTVNARVVLNAGSRAAGQLRLMLDGQPIDLDPDSPGTGSRLELEPGLRVVSQPLRLPPGPVHRVEAIFEPDDARASAPDLLRAEGVTFTSDHGRVLVLAEHEQAARPLIDSLSSDELKVEIRPAATAPHDLAGWSGYDAVILFDQPASNFTLAQQSNLARYVEDAGGGLLVVGGPESYGAGGWIGSPLEKLLPLQLDPPQKRQLPMGALAIVIDRSGSMSTEVTGSGMNQQGIANEAAALAVRSLSRLDQVAVVAFSDGYETVVPLTRCSAPDDIARRIRAIGSGGGTNMFPAIEAAAVEVLKSPGGVKHIIVLTDGETIGDARVAINRVAALQRLGVTLSTIAIGDAPNGTLLRQLAEAGGGRWHTVASGALPALPQIFIKEAQTIRRTLIWEGPAFSPKLAFADESMRGLSTPLPAMTGYVVTADRGGLSSVSLRGPEGDPILARWQHGLGRVTAFTSDATSRWNAGWISWPGFRSFWSQQLKWTMRPSGDALARLAVENRGERARVTLELLDSSGERASFAAIAGRLVSPTTGTDAPDGSRHVQFQQVGPGRYEAEVDAAAVGSHLLSVKYTMPGATADSLQGKSGTVRAAIVRRAGDELRQATPDTATLWSAARQTNGRIHRLDAGGVDLWNRDHLTMPIASRAIWMLAALAAIGLFLVDVAARRITIEWGGVRKHISALWSAGPGVATAPVGVLTAAKKRAADQREMAVEDSGPAPLAAPMRAGIDPPTSKPGPTPATNTPPAGDADGDVMDRLRAAKRRGRNSTDSGDGTR